MDNPIFIACLLNFAVVAAAAIEMRRVGERGFDVSHVSYELRVPLAWLAIIAFPLAVYCLIKSQGVIAGMGMWCGLTVILAIIAVAIRSKVDGVLTALGIASALAGYWLFWQYV
jgi:hypothetical protein